MRIAFQALREEEMFNVNKKINSCYSVIGILNEEVDPTPFFESTEIVPPCELRDKFINS